MAGDGSPSAKGEAVTVNIGASKAQESSRVGETDSASCPLSRLPGDREPRGEGHQVLRECLAGPLQRSLTRNGPCRRGHDRSGKTRTMTALGPMSFALERGLSSSPFGGKSSKDYASQVL